MAVMFDRKMGLRDTPAEIDSVRSAMQRFGLLFCLVMSLSDLHAQASDEDAIKDLLATWRHAVNTSDVPLYLSVLHEDVRLIAPGAEPINSKTSYADFLEPVFEGATYQIEVVQPADVTVIDDMAVAEYEYVIHLTLKDPARAISEPGAITASRSQARYFDVFRKDEAGNWLVWRHTWQNR